MLTNEHNLKLLTATEEESEGSNFDTYVLLQKKIDQ